MAARPGSPDWAKGRIGAATRGQDSLCRTSCCGKRTYGGGGPRCRGRRPRLPVRSLAVTPSPASYLRRPKHSKAPCLTKRVLASRHYPENIALAFLTVERTQYTRHAPPCHAMCMHWHADSIIPLTMTVDDRLPLPGLHPYRGMRGWEPPQGQGTLWPLRRALANAC